jgi:hypothetical protein
MVLVIAVPLLALLVAVLCLAAAAALYLLEGLEPVSLLATEGALALLGLILLVAGAVIAWRSRRPEPVTEGLELLRHQHLGLWQLLDGLATDLETRPFDGARLVSDARLESLEEFRAMGLRPGRRILLLGWPLLLHLDVTVLSALLAHELAHFGDGRPRARDRRAMLAFRAIRDGRRTNPVGRAVYDLLLRRCSQRSAPGIRALELEADARVAPLVGAGPLAYGLWEMGPLEDCWQGYLERVRRLTDAAERTPADLAGGFHGFLRDTDVVEIRHRSEAQFSDRRGRFDPHPPLAERLGALRAMSAQQPAQTDRRLAAELISDSATHFSEASRRAFGRPTPERPEAGWDEIFARGHHVVATEQALALFQVAGVISARQVRNLANALEVWDAGYGHAIAERLDRDTFRAGGGDRVAVGAMLNLAGEALVARGTHRWGVSWGQPRLLRQDGRPEWLPALSVESGGAIALGARLVTLGASASFRPELPAPPGPQSELEGGETEARPALAGE